MEIKPQIGVKNRKTGETQTFRLDQDRLVVGRDHSNYIALEGKSISRRHAEILQEGNQFFLRDLKSNNGTLLNDRKLPAGEKTLLRSGDLIRIEDYELRFHLPAMGEVEDLHETTDTDLLEIKMIKKLLRAMDRENAPSLEIMEGPKAGSRFVLEGKNQTIVIGRDPACEFLVDSDVISRKHARIEKRFDTVILHDLGSKNGTYVNREKVKEKRLQDGDIVHLGTLPLLFRNPQELSFDLAPPAVKKEEPVPPEPVPSFIPPSIPPGPEARVAKRQEPAEEIAPVPSPATISPSELLILIVGLAVLVGGIWGIVKLLK